MLNQGNSQTLNNFNRQQLEDQITLDNQIRRIVSQIFLNNLSYMQAFKNNGNSYLKINGNIPPIQYQNLKNNINIEGELGESNLLDLIRNLSIEPSNLNLNNNPSISSNMHRMNSPIGIGYSFNQQNQTNYGDNGLNNLLLKQALLLQLLKNSNQINQQVNNQINNPLYNNINNQIHNQLRNQNKEKDYLNILAQNIANKTKINNIQNNGNQILNYDNFNLINRITPNINNNGLNKISNSINLSNNILSNIIKNPIKNHNQNQLKYLSNKNYVDPASLMMNNNNLNMNHNIINNYYNQNNNLNNNNTVNINDYNDISRLEGLYNCINNMTYINNNNFKNNFSNNLNNLNNFINNNNLNTFLNNSNLENAPFNINDLNQIEINRINQLKNLEFLIQNGNNLNINLNNNNLINENLDNNIILKNEKPKKFQKRK